MTVSAHTVAACDFESGSSEPALILGLSPVLSKRMILPHVEGLAQLLSRELKRCVKVKLPSSREDFYRALLKGEYDIAQAPPHTNHLLASQFAFTPLVQSSNQTRTIVIVAATSTITRLEDLKHKNIAVPGEISSVGAFFNRMLKLADVPVDEVNRVLKPGHYEVLTATALAEVDAGISIDFYLNRLAVRNRLKVIAESKKMPMITMLAKPGLSKQLTAEITQVFLLINTDPLAEDHLSFFGIGHWIPLTISDLLSFSVNDLELISELVRIR